MKLDPKAGRSGKAPHTSLLIAGAIFALAALVLPSGHASAAEARKPNIIYILTDQWRAQAFGYAGDPNVKTPNIDAFAARSVNFRNAVAAIPVCTPYRAALLTGRYPLSTGMFLNDLHLPSKELTMAEIFKEAGYRTGYIGKWHLDGHGRSAFIPAGRRQGFDYWKVLECTHDYNNSQYYDNDDPQIRTWPGYDAYAQTKDAQAYIRRHAQAENPFLLLVSYGGPHFPHETAPADLMALYPAKDIRLRPNVPAAGQAAARRESRGYYAHCTAIDKCVGDLLGTIAETGIARDTIVVFTSDHGEMLGSQGVAPKEKQVPWDESIRIPFLLSYPPITGGKGRTVEAPLNTPDILPTLLSLSAIKVPETVEGEDLSAYVKGETDADRAALIMSVSPFAGYLQGKPYRGIRTARHTYVRSPDGPWMMYDNKADPYQMENLIGDPSHAGLQKELEEKLQARLRETGDDFLSPAEYHRMWGLKPDDRGCIPYGPDSPPQSPAKRP
ncbi:sulfatase [Akkermansiaceae bacterium]|nr:sulfatase [Akkermansiaceae bacterium]